MAQILHISKQNTQKMSKKMRIPPIFKNKETKQPWHWPLCKHTKTLSFRAQNDDVSTTVSSVFLDLESHHSLILNSSSSLSTDQVSEVALPMEMVMSGVRLSERLFFEPDETSSIMKESKASDHGNHPFKDSIVLDLESDDPYLDFKKSMQEMVESEGLMLKDWDCLEELLGWYLRMNVKMNHAFIVGAFVDLIVGFATKKTMISHSDSSTYSSASSSFSSPSSPKSS